MVPVHVEVLEEVEVLAQLLAGLEVMVHTAGSESLSGRNLLPLLLIQFRTKFWEKETMIKNN